MIPDEIRQFSEVFSKLPSIGPRMAIRLAYTIANLNLESQTKLLKALENLKNIDRCSNCLAFKIKEQNLCNICKTKERQQDIIMVVEKETDISSMEASHKYNGTYFIFGPLPHREVMEERHEIRIRILKQRIEKQGNKIQEIILALPHTPHGALLTETLKTELKAHTDKITQLARGLPTGADIEFADSETLRNALEFRI